MTSCASERYHDVRADQGYLGSAAPLLSPVVLEWPVNGIVIHSYGMKEDGVSLKGMILGCSSDRVSAAADGLVAYTDENLRGFGKTVIVEHAGGYSTVYARLSEIHVKAGQTVRSRQVIAKASQLYFEVRRDAKPIDPQRILKK